MRQVRPTVTEHLISHSTPYILFKIRLDFDGYYRIFNNTTHIIEHI
jgi:hypothetical protein